MSVSNVRIKKRKQINAFAFLADFLYNKKETSYFQQSRNEQKWNYL